MRSTSPSPAPVPARPTAGGPPPRRLVLRGAGAGGAALVLALVGGCRLRLGTGAPESLPSPPAAEEARDQLARRAVLIASTADVVADGGSMDAAGPAQGLASAARTQLQALGGVWEPWASESPAADPDRPTASPAATASPGATVHDLVTALTEGATQASTAARESSEATAARLYASLGVAWLLGTAALDAQAAEISGRSPSSLTDPLPDGVLEAYDAVRYALQEVAARAEGDERARALADAQYAAGIVSASLALGGQDGRLSAYATPTRADDGASSDVTWAREAWSTVMGAELVAVAADGGQATSGAVDAAAAAGLRARAWGAAVDEALPGYTSA